MDAEQRAFWEAIQRKGEPQLRRLCAERGLDWDTMSDTEREDFVDDLLHENQ